MIANKNIVALNEKLFKDTKFRKIADELYIYKNFLSKEEAESVHNKVKSDPLFDNHNGGILLKPESDFNQRLIDSLSNNIDNFYFSTERIANSFDKVIIRYQDQGDVLHTDIHRWMQPYLDAEEGFSLIQDETFKHMVNFPLVSFVLYYNDDFEGGEIFYPEYGLKYKPKAGDLIAHNATAVHSVNRVGKGGYRLSYQGSISFSAFVKEEDKKVFDEAQNYINEIHESNRNGQITDKSFNDFMFDYKIHQLPVINKRLKPFVDVKDEVEWLRNNELDNIE